MDWREYQDTVSELYKQAEGVGVVSRNITIPDMITGQPRQVDCWIKVKTKGHKLGILVDAKFHKNKINVNHVDAVSSLAKAIGANKAILVCPNGWSAPAENKADAVGIDLRLWTLEEAIEFMNPDFWMLCPICDIGFIIMDNDGFTELMDGSVLWWLAGQCKKCKGGVVWCQGCGQKLIALHNKTQWCHCGHMWRLGKRGLSIYTKHRRKLLKLPFH